MHYHYFTIEQRESLERLIRTRPDTTSLLQRLHDPEYGVCKTCGADIPYVRLLDSPGADHCASCQSGIKVVALDERT